MKQCGRSEYVLFHGTIPDFAWRDRGKIGETSAPKKWYVVNSAILVPASEHGYFVAS
jgi:hypothetical protein